MIMSILKLLIIIYCRAKYKIKWWLMSKEDKVKLLNDILKEGNVIIDISSI